MADPSEASVVEGEANVKEVVDAGSEGSVDSGPDSHATTSNSNPTTNAVPKNLRRAEVMVRNVPTVCSVGPRGGDTEISAGRTSKAEIGDQSRRIGLGIVGNHAREDFDNRHPEGLC